MRTDPRFNRAEEAGSDDDTSTVKAKAGGVIGEAWLLSQNIAALPFFVFVSVRHPRNNQARFF
jgi:hypothetical protein